VYLARHTIKGKPRFFIKESLKEGRFFRYRTLFDLGDNPWQYIVYPGGNAYYIHEVVEEALYALNANRSPEDLDDLFWPFIKPEIRRAIETFRRRANRGRQQGPMDPQTKAELRFGVHLFDKRRILFLRCGQAGQNRIGRIPATLCLQFVDKCRDEIEQNFLTQEQCLKPSELKAYVYTVFDLQRFFPESFARTIPQGLDQNKLEKHFKEAICRLQSDRSFWGGQETGDLLHEYLIRYVIMFFDNDFAQRSPWDDYLKDFIARNRAGQTARRSRAASWEKASTVLGIKEQVLRTMTKQGISKVYRRMAQKLHPDKGGTHEEFVRLTEVYKELLKTKGIKK
jgi:hypothetical protein